MTETIRHMFDTTGDWQDLVALAGNLAPAVDISDVDIVIQGMGKTGTTQVVWGGGTAPTIQNLGEIVRFQDSLGPGSAANIWFRSDTPENAKLQVTIS